MGKIVQCSTEKLAIKVTVDEAGVPLTDNLALFIVGIDPKGEVLWTKEGKPMLFYRRDFAYPKSKPFLESDVSLLNGKYAQQIFINMLKCVHFNTLAVGLMILRPTDAEGNRLSLGSYGNINVSLYSHTTSTPVVLDEAEFKKAFTNETILHIGEIYISKNRQQITRPIFKRRNLSYSLSVMEFLKTLRVEKAYE